MAFVQIVDYHTSDPDKVDHAIEEWQRATEGRRTARRAIVTRDRSDPGRYVCLVFFDSYESAMENSELPETRALAEQIEAGVDRPTAFHDLDVVDDRSLIPVSSSPG